jgi:hypothetical protein
VSDGVGVGPVGAQLEVHSRIGAAAAAASNQQLAAAQMSVVMGGSGVRGTGMVRATATTTATTNTNGRLRQGVSQQLTHTAPQRPTLKVCIFIFFCPSPSTFYHAHACALTALRTEYLACTNRPVLCLCLC